MITQTFIDELLAAAHAEDVQQLVVGAVVEDDGKVLLLQRPMDDFMGGIFELPSGKVEPGEAIDAALRREVAEETGLTVAKIASYIGSFDYTSGSGNKSRQFNFAVATTTVEPLELTEHDNYTWVPLDGTLPVSNAVEEILRTHRSHQDSKRQNGNTMP